MKHVLPTLFLFLFGLLFPVNIYALVSINEFLPNSTTEWVEFKNDTGDAEYLKAYYLDDDTDFISDSGSSSKKILSTLNTENSAYPFFDTSGFLNNAGDHVVLFTGDGLIVDQYQYTSDPGLNISIGRVPDGTGNFEILPSTSKGAPNPLPTTSPSPSESPSVTETPTSTQTPSPTPSKSIYKINKPKDENGQTISSVKIYVDNQYTHHEDDEILEFCDSCFCDNDKVVSCGFGEHTIKLSKSGYADWSEFRSIASGTNFETTPILTKLPESTPNQTPTQTTTQTPTQVSTKTPSPTKTPSLTPSSVQASSSASVSAVLGDSTSSASISSIFAFLTPTPEIKYSKPLNYKTPFFIGIFLSVSSGALLYFRHRKD